MRRGTPNDMYRRLGYMSLSNPKREDIVVDVVVI